MAEQTITLIKFGAEWCNPCKTQDIILKPVLEANPEVVYVYVDVDKQEDLKTQYEVMSVPTIVINKDGQTVYKESGLHGEEQLQELINQYK